MGLSAPAAIARSATSRGTAWRSTWPSWVAPVLALLLGVAVLGAPPAAIVAEAAAGRPNIVVIMADDMRADELRVMPHTRRLLGQLDLTDFVSNHPICCPARAEFLTGQYGHHNGVHHNYGPYGTYEALQGKNNTVARWFQDAGYRTGVSGKFLNGWQRAWEQPVPQGWDHFAVLVENPELGLFSDYHPWRYRIYDAESDTRTGHDLHINDVVTTDSVETISEFAAAGAPFLHWASYIAPHTMRTNDGRWRPPVPAARHRGMFASEPNPARSKPSFRKGRLTGLTKLARARLRSLQSVDEGVRDIVRATRRAGVYDETVFVFTSDNGYLLGEHGRKGKNVPFEEALRVPLLARGPGVSSGRSAKTAMITDIAPSISALAGVEPARPQDGRPDLFDPTAGPPRVLIQAGNDNHDLPWWWRGVRTRKWTYVEYVDGGERLYNRRRDPFQLTNLVTRRPAVRDRLHGHYQAEAGLE